MAPGAGIFGASSAGPRNPARPPAASGCSRRACGGWCRGRHRGGSVSNRRALGSEYEVRRSAWRIRLPVAVEVDFGGLAGGDLNVDPYDLPSQGLYPQSISTRGKRYDVCPGSIVDLLHETSGGIEHFVGLVGRELLVGVRRESLGADDQRSSVRRRSERRCGANRLWNLHVLLRARWQ